MLKKLFLSTAATLAFAAPLSASAQAVPTAPTAKPAAPAPAAPPTTDADPALWVVRDADTTIYLFGTVHVLKPGLSWFDEAVKTAFDKSDEVVLEIVSPSPEAAQAAIMTTAVNATGPSLTDRLPAGDRPRYTAALADLGVPAAAFDRLDPWFAATTMTMVKLQKAGYDPTSGAEATITAAAKAASKPVSALETIEQQLGFFDSLSEPAQLALMTETLKQLPDTEKTIGEMVAQWSKGDAEALSETINEGLKTTPEIAKILLNDRNERWAGWIAERMAKPGTVFIAVGAGHLAGSESVQRKLAAHKLSATRVAY